MKLNKQTKTHEVGFCLFIQFLIPNPSPYLVVNNRSLIFSYEGTGLAGHGHLGERGEVAGHEVLRLTGRGHVTPRGHLLLADVLREPAPGVEAAARRRVEWRGHVPLE